MLKTGGGRNRQHPLALLGHVGYGSSQRLCRIETLQSRGLTKAGSTGIC